MTLPDRSGSHMPLFWRVFLVNAAILLAGVLVLGLTPLRVSSITPVPEIIDLLAGLALMIVANWLILRPLFRPLERLAEQMDKADVLRGGQRVPGRPGGLRSRASAIAQWDRRYRRPDGGGRAGWRWPRQCRVQRR